MSAEIWKDIKGYEGRYQVSNKGRVRSFVNRDKSNPCIIRKPVPDRRGYSTVVLWIGSHNRCLKIHRLVAEAFIENPMNYPQVNHKDEDKTNNAVENLEWCDNKYNNTYHDIQKRKTIPVIQYDLQGNEIARYYGLGEAERQTGVFHCEISKVAKHRRKTAGGYKWEFLS